MRVAPEIILSAKEKKTLEKKQDTPCMTTCLFNSVSTAK